MWTLWEIVRYQGVKYQFLPDIKNVPLQSRAQALTY